jgi:hypothetical protein
MPLAQDTVEITSTAALACGQQGAQKVAFQRAAVETIRRGYDRFLIINGGGQTNVHVLGYTPVTAYATGPAVTVYGGQPIYGGSHNQGLVVKMFRAGDPTGANALDARQVLGPGWQDAVSKNTWTCLS